MIKKITLIGTIILCFNSILYSQNGSRDNRDLSLKKDNVGEKGFFGIALGRAFPKGDFSTDVSDPKSGFAKNGLHLNANFNYNFFTQFGLAMLLGRNSHSVDESAMSEVIFGSSPFQNKKITTDSWTSSYFMTGLLIYFPSDVVTFNIKGLGGIANSKIPTINASFSDGLNQGQVILNEATASAFAMGFSVGLKINISPYVAFSTSLDYISTTPTFSVATTTNYGYSSIDEVQQEINMLNFTFGIGIRIF